jgi:hypothetical protein
MSENLDNCKEKIEKPKRTLTKAQLDNLEKMRKKKLLKCEARKMIEAQSKQSETNILKTPNNSIKDYSNDIEDLKKEVNFISGYIKEKQNRKQIQQQSTYNQQKIPTHEEEQEYIEFIPIKKSLINSIIKK